MFEKRGLFMYDFLLLVIIPTIMLVPLAYLVGYQLRSFVPQKRRLMVGFAVILLLMPISFILSLEFQAFSRLIQSVQIATSTGFPLGIAGPPFKDPKKKNVQK